MGFNEKAQVSTEVVLMIGIAVVGVVVFGALYLGDVNKNTRASTSIFVYDSNSSYVKWASKNPIENTQQAISEVCGDGVIRFPEQCDGTDLGYKPGIVPFTPFGLHQAKPCKHSREKRYAQVDQNALRYLPDSYIYGHSL